VAPRLAIGTMPLRRPEILRSRHAHLAGLIAESVTLTATWSAAGWAFLSPSETTLWIVRYGCIFIFRLSLEVLHSVASGFFSSPRGRWVRVEQHT
jgi:hypothetical protein